MFWKKKKGENIKRNLIKIDVLRFCNNLKAIISETWKKWNLIND